MFINKRDIERLSADIRRAIDGEQIDFRENSEGVWSILKNDIYTLSSRLNEQADNLSREKSGMSTALADISHQLKTPLTSALMMSELLENEELPPKKRQEFLRSLQNSLEHTEQLVLSLLKIAKLDSGTIDFKREIVMSDALINSAILPLKVMLESRNQTLNVNCAEVSVVCDKTWTSEALTNIVKNASEYSPDGGEITINGGDNALFGYISVTDSGEGLTREQIPRLFERFQSANKRGGVGIGLNMARTIMRSQGGDIEVTIPNTFTLKFFK
ncbi:MAG: HAMP domain-containing histidine kinase [Oscillospiraceae bacterium]|jgi:signal transduction histidine kinase|nr:HAMP domain-containing histidine kinase [Oscillospiraceae bacterium]